MSRLSFTSRNKDPIEFDIDGEAFAIAPIGAWAFFDLAEMAATAGDDSIADPVEKATLQAQQSVKVRDMFRDHMEPAEYERFDKFCRSPRGPDVGLLMEVIQGLVAETTGRPTEPPSPSGSGRPTTGLGSTDSASLPESTSETSHSAES